MKDIFGIIITIIFVNIFMNCSNSTPKNALIDEEYEIVRKNVQTFLGADYKAENFTIITENFVDGMQNQYIINFAFDLNKKYLLYEGKNIPAKLLFEKFDEGDWRCTYNSVHVEGVLNLLK